MIKKPIFKLILMALCVFALPVLANPDKIALEEHLTIISQDALNTIYGEGNFIVRVQLAMTAPRYQVKYTEQSSPKMSKKKGKGKEVYLLPGYPALKNLSPDAMSQIPFNSVTTLMESKVRKMNVLVIVNKDMSRSLAKKSEPILKQLLSFKASRGDAIKYEYKKFYFQPAQVTQNITISDTSEKVLSLQNMFYLFFLLLFIGFLAVYVWFKLKESKASAASAEGGGGAGPVNVNVNPNLELKGAGGGGGGGAGGKMSMGEGIKQYFDFVSDANLNEFIILIKDKKIPADMLSMILSFLSAPLAAQVLSQLDDPALKAEATALLIEQRQGKRETLDKLESQIKSALECFVGGQKTFSDVFEYVSEDTKKGLLDQLKQTNQAAHDKVRSHIFLFEDIIELDNNDLGMILSDCNMELLATSLISVEQGFYQRIDENLTNTAREMISQYLEVKKESTSAKDIEAAQDYMIKLVKKLDESGKISLKKEANPA